MSLWNAIRNGTPRMRGSSKLGERPGRHPLIPGLYIDPLSGLPMPYYTRGALSLLNQLDLEGFKVLEIGSGRSSHWWTFKTCTQVTSLETSEFWASRYGLHHVVTSYRDHLAEFEDESFDVVIVDGDPVGERDLLASLALPLITKSENSMLIVDNYLQPSVGLASMPFCQGLADSCHVLIFSEFLHPDWKTAIFFPNRLG